MPPALPLISGVVPRARLLARLNEDRPLTVVAARSGFGKTALLSDN